MTFAAPHVRNREGGPLRALVVLAMLSLVASLAAASFYAFGSSSDATGVHRSPTAQISPTLSIGSPDPMATDGPLDGKSGRDSLPAPGPSSQNASLETADDGKDSAFAALPGGSALLVGRRVYGAKISPSPTVRLDADRVSQELLSRPPPVR